MSIITIETKYSPGDKVFVIECVTKGNRERCEHCNGAGKRHVKGFIPNFVVCEKCRGLGSINSPRYEWCIAKHSKPSEIRRVSEINYWNKVRNKYDSSSKRVYYWISGFMYRDVSEERVFTTELMAKNRCDELNSRGPIWRRPT